MFEQEELLCPKCESDNIETAFYAYRSLATHQAGKRLFSDNPHKYKITKFTPVQREKLLKELTPPREPHISLPAGTIAVMAFALSWLLTSSAIISLIGPKMYMITSIFITIFITVFFSVSIKAIMKSYRKRLASYRKKKTAYNKKIVCGECFHVFTRPENIPPV